MLTRDPFAVANLLVFSLEVRRSSSSLHATALLILDFEFDYVDMRYPLFLFYRQLADETVHCTGSATYQICFRLPNPNPNRNSKP